MLPPVPIRRVEDGWPLAAGDRYGDKLSIGAIEAREGGIVWKLFGPNLPAVLRVGLVAPQPFEERVAGSRLTGRR
jgi:hypothetical protein